MEKQSTKERINEKILEIEEFINELSEFIPQSMELEEYKKDFKTKAIFERYAEKIIEAIEDLAFLIVNDKGLKFPDYEKEVFDTLFNKGLISKELSTRLRDAKGMRNIIAHEYGKIDDEIVFHAVTEEIIKDTKEFLEKIRGLR